MTNRALPGHTSRSTARMELKFEWSQVGHSTWYLAGGVLSPSEDPRELFTTTAEGLPPLVGCRAAEITERRRATKVLLPSDQGLIIFCFNTRERNIKHAHSVSWAFHSHHAAGQPCSAVGLVLASHPSGLGVFASERCSPHGSVPCSEAVPGLRVVQGTRRRRRTFPCGVVFT